MPLSAASNPSYLRGDQYPAGKKMWLSSFLAGRSASKQAFRRPVGNLWERYKKRAKDQKIKNPKTQNQSRQG
jgi:hypothetical protein